MVNKVERFHCDYCPAEFQKYEDALRHEETHEETPSWQQLEIEKLTDELLGRRLKRARQEVGLNQKEVGKYLECSHAAISDRERGIAKTSAIELAKLAVLYQKPLSFFFEVEPEGEELSSS